MAACRDSLLDSLNTLCDHLSIGLIVELVLLAHLGLGLRTKDLLKLGRPNLLVPLHTAPLQHLHVLDHKRASPSAPKSAVLTVLRNNLRNVLFNLVLLVGGVLLLGTLPFLLFLLTAHNHYFLRDQFLLLIWTHKI